MDGSVVGSPGGAARSASRSGRIGALMVRLCCSELPMISRMSTLHALVSTGPLKCSPSWSDAAPLRDAGQRRCDRETWRSLLGQSRESNLRSSDGTNGCFHDGPGSAPRLTAPGLVAQHVLLDLAGGGLGQLGEDHGPRAFEVGEQRAAMLDQILLGCCGVGFEGDEGARDSPHFASGRATTAASSTAGWR